MLFVFVMSFFREWLFVFVVWIFILSVKGRKAACTIDRFWGLVVLDDMKIKGIAPWYGGKRSMATKIVEQIGKHRSYWEPFCGSMAVLFAKPVCRTETVNDLHGDLINMARVIQYPEMGSRLYDKLKRTLCAERFFRESKERWISGEYVDGEMDIERAYDYFVASWLGLNGVSGTERCNIQFAVRWTDSGGHGAARWRSVVGSMPAWHQRLQNVLILQRDAFDIVGNIKDADGVAIYCDPPYIKKSDKYRHDFEESSLYEKSGHEQLAESLARFQKARVIVSYYDHPDLKKLYPGWKKITVPKTRQSLRNATRGPKKKPAADRVEVLLVNER